MGQEIATTRFRAEDFERYKGRCKRELALLRAPPAARGADDRRHGRQHGVILERHGPDLGALVRVYREHSHAGAPAHTWDV